MDILKTSTIYRGDNLDWLKQMPSGSVDLIYADPPFNSNRDYNNIWNDGSEIKAFEDTWEGGINQYIKTMRPRLIECHRLLRHGGSMYLHCDWHADAHLRILMDKIFEPNNFKNEIIWEYGQGIKASSKKFLSNHDMILFYTKANTKSTHSTFTPQPIPYTEHQLERFKYGLFGKLYRNSIA